MKGFFKVLGALVAAAAFVVGVLAIVDKVCNKNRIKGDYLLCDSDEEEIAEE